MNLERNNRIYRTSYAELQEKSLMRHSLSHLYLSRRMKSLESATAMADFLTKSPYTPPSWASHLRPLPSHAFSLAHISVSIRKCPQISIYFPDIRFFEYPYFSEANQIEKLDIYSIRNKSQIPSKIRISDPCPGLGAVHILKENLIMIHVTTWISDCIPIK
ncbi:hypothetical protein YC2023_080019 [Brassica napus]